MNKRPEGQILTEPDPEEFRCPTCNPRGYNRTGRVPPVSEEIDTETMWGTHCFDCIEGWKEYEDVELY